MKKRIQFHVGGHTHHLFGEVNRTGEFPKLFLVQTQCLCQIRAVTLMTSSRETNIKQTVAEASFND